VKKFILLPCILIIAIQSYKTSVWGNETPPANDKQSGEALHQEESDTTETLPEEKKNEKKESVNVELDVNLVNHKEDNTDSESSEEGSEDDGFFAESGDEYTDDGEEILIKDSIEPYNRFMFSFNDKFYYYFFKPIYTGYSKVVPAPARKSVRNFFSNVKTPIRFFNCLFQGKLKGAGTELLRLTINSTIGLGGFFDVAKSEFNLKAQEEDFGQTLGKHKAGSGTYIVLPIMGPSNVRDTVGFVGDIALNPLSWVSYFFLAPIEGFGVGAYDITNTGSLEAEDTYESIVEPAIDPYIALQDAYIKNRQKKINE